MFIRAYATGGAGGRGTASGNRSGQGFRNMSQYYRAVGQSAMGASARTRGRLAPIRPARGR